MPIVLTTDFPDLKLSARGADGKGIIIADTKFEYGIHDGYISGGPQPSYDKQFLRDYLETLDWGKTAPPPPLPDEIVRKTGEKYVEDLVRLSGTEKRTA